MGEGQRFKPFKLKGMWVFCPWLKVVIVGAMRGHDKVIHESRGKLTRKQHFGLFEARVSASTSRIPYTAYAFPVACNAPEALGLRHQINNGTLGLSFTLNPRTLNLAH